MKLSFLPLVSICVPTYNSARYVRETLDSLLAQTYHNVEIIVSDNASLDETPAILREYADKHGIRVLLNESNVGAGGNFNRLVAAARGEFIAIYHADDLYDPSIVAESVSVLQADDSLGLVGTMAQAIDRSGKFLYSFALPRNVVNFGSQSYGFDTVMHGVLRTAGHSIFFITPSIMVRTKYYRELGGFDQQAFRSSVDYEMWLRIAVASPVAIIDRPLMCYRLHEQQGSEHEVRKNVELPDLYPVILSYRHMIGSPRVKRICDATLDRIVFKTALKQNYVRRFAQSTITAGMARTIPYRLAGHLLMAANVLHLNCCIKP